jgi:predicted  nucleic acid-binding Zn-ribbon protein
MAGFYDCMAAVVAAVGRRISMEEFDALYQRLLDEKDGLFAKGFPADWLTAAQSVAGKIEAEKRIAQRQLVLSKKVYAEGKSFIAAARDQVDAGRALEARLVGINTPIEGGRNSAAAQSHGLRSASIGALLADLRRQAGGNDRLIKLFSTPAFETDVAKALRGEPAHPDAVKIGQAIERVREDLRRQENEAGGWRAKLDGYITRQSHDTIRVARAGFDKWRAYVLPRLDHERTFDRQESLKGELRQERGQVLQHRLAAGAEVAALHDQLATVESLDKKAEARGRRYDKQLDETSKGFAATLRTYLDLAEKPASAERNAARIELERQRGRLRTLAGKAEDARRLQPELADRWKETADLADRASKGIELLDDLGHKLVDYEKRLQGAIDPDTLLLRIYNAIKADTWMTGQGTGEFSGLLQYLGPANMAKRRAAHRELHFKSAEDEVQYMRDFGVGGLSDGVLREIEGAANAIAIYRTLSTNPEAMFGLWRTELLQEARATGNNELTRAVSRKTLDWELAEVLGATRQVSNPTLASWGATIRTLQGMAKLGGAMLSSFADIPTAAAELTYQGRGALDSYSELFRGLLKGRRTGERAILADLLGVGFESLSGHVLSRLGGESAPPGAVARASALFFRLNGLSWWTDAHKATAGLVLSRYYASLQEHAFEDLPAPVKRTFRQFAIAPGDWEILRQAAVQADESGKTFLTPEGVRQIPLGYLMNSEAERLALASESPGGEIGFTDQERAAREKRDRLAAAYATLITDRVEHAVVTPGARERAMANFGTGRGDILGEGLRFIMQFKSFGLAMVMRSFGREIHGGGSPLSATTRLAFLAFQLGIFGYITMLAKDTIAGKNPRDPQSPDTWAAAMAQGGGMGILGDFAFGEFSRFGQSALGTAAGPTFGNVNDLFHLWAQARDTDAITHGTYGKNVAASSLRMIASNTPFASLWWLRPAVNYLALYPVQEAINPGYLKRMEGRIQRENKQTFWLSPSREAPRL